MAGSLGFLYGSISSSSFMFMPDFLKVHFPETRPLIGEYLSAYRGSICTLSGQLGMRLFVAMQSFAGSLGALAAVPLTQRLGRRTGIAVGVSLFILGELLLATSQRPWTAWAGRALGGAAFGVILPAIFLEIVEVSMPGNRGTLASFFVLGQGMGLLCTGLITFGFGTAKGGTGWRFVHMWSLWPALVTLACLACMPETPASLIERGKVAEGREALQHIRGPWYPDIESEVHQMIGDADLRRVRASSIRLLLAPQHLPAMAVGVLLGITHAWSGGMRFFTLPVLMGTALSLKQSDLVASVITSVAFLAGAVVCTFAIDRPGGRRGVFVAGYTGCGLAFAASAGLAAAIDRDQPLDQEAMLALGGSAMFAAIFFFVGLGSAAVLFVYVTETHSLATRAIGSAVAMSILNALKGITSLFVLPILCISPVKLFAGLSVFFSLFVVPAILLLVVETSGVPLERMQDAWRAHWLWRAFFGARVAAPPPLAAAARAAAAAAGGLRGCCSWRDTPQGGAGTPGPSDGERDALQQPEPAGDFGSTGTATAAAWVTGAGAALAAEAADAAEAAQATSVASAAAP